MIIIKKSCIFALFKKKSRKGMAINTVKPVFQIQKKVILKRFRIGIYNNRCNNPITLNVRSCDLLLPAINKIAQTICIRILWGFKYFLKCWVWAYDDILSWVITWNICINLLSHLFELANPYFFVALCHKWLDNMIIVLNSWINPINHQRVKPLIRSLWWNWLEKNFEVSAFGRITISLFIFLICFDFGRSDKHVKFWFST